MNGYAYVADICLFSTGTAIFCCAGFHVSVCFQEHISHVSFTMLLLLPSLHGVSWMGTYPLVCCLAVT